MSIEFFQENGWYFAVQPSKMGRLWLAEASRQPPQGKQREPDEQDVWFSYGTSKTKVIAQLKAIVFAIEVDP